MGRSNTLLCAAMPFGYGPASKLLALAPVLARDWRLVFVGRGAALELVSRSPGAFDAIVAGSLADPATRHHVKEATAVLTVMDRDAGAAAAQQGRALFVVDSLLWWRRGVPAALARAATYFAQAFPGLDPAAYAPRPTVVGPIVAPTPAVAERRGLLIHLGGSAAPEDRRALYTLYARAVVRSAERAGLFDRFPRVTVLGGSVAIDALAGHVDRGHVELASLAPWEARRRMAGAEAVLTSPGLTATLECFHDGTPTWFLPPQNASQWRILQTLRQEGVAEGALHWEDLSDEAAFADGLATTARDAIVVRAIVNACTHEATLDTLRACLTDVGSRPAERSMAGQAFFDSLGPPGVGSVARGLLSACTARGTPESP